MCGGGVPPGDTQRGRAPFLESFRSAGRRPPLVRQGRSACSQIAPCFLPPLPLRVNGSKSTVPPRRHRGLTDTKTVREKNLQFCSDFVVFPGFESGGSPKPGATRSQLSKRLDGAARVALSSRLDARRFAPGANHDAKKETAPRGLRRAASERSFGYFAIPNFARISFGQSTSSASSYFEIFSTVIASSLSGTCAPKPPGIFALSTTIVSVHSIL